MPQEYIASNRRSRRAYWSADDRDDRGWTMLHIGARKGDIKEVYILVSFCLKFIE